MRQKLVRIQISHQELLRKMLMLLQIFHSFNNSIYRSEFPSNLKLPNITPVFKKGDRNFKENYRPISILSII